MYKIHNPGVYALYAKKVIDSCERKDHLNTCFKWVIKNPLIKSIDMVSLLNIIDNKLYNEKGVKNEKRTNSTR